jgi:hypothetical protein|tara:strand:- start:111 stop:296 length:186 start_codon:yes stop_codon:yes gene_type:complete
MTEKKKDRQWDGRSRPTNDTYAKNWHDIFNKGVINDETTLKDLNEILKENEEYLKEIKNKL